MRKAFTPSKITPSRFRVSPAVTGHPDTLRSQEEALVIMAFITSYRRVSHLLGEERVYGTRVVERAAGQEKGRGEYSRFDDVHVAS